MGYSDEYVKYMTALHQTLRTDPDTAIKLVAGPDDLCKQFPSDQPCHCEDDTVHRRDAVVVERLGLVLGQSYAWRFVQQVIAEVMTPSDLPTICNTCPWLSYGVCEDGIRRVQQGDGLYRVE